MDTNNSLKVVIDPDEWIEKAYALRSSGEVLYDLFETTFDRMEVDGFNVLEEDKALAFLRISQMLYGLAVEDVLKAELIRRHPEKIKLEMVSNGKGDAEKVTLSFRGVDGHDLVGLAKAGGVFGGDNSSYKPHVDLKDVLRLLGERVLWSGRYSTPSRSGEDYEWKKHVPMIRLSSGFREVIDPLLDEYLR